MSGESLSNDLAGQSSPYLRQHADNPVAWQVWGDEAFALAARLERPILLSIGYSACHWCHVMERESFADTHIAEQLNQSFVSIKVDREERPDIDEVYQLAHQMLSGNAGGWPLTLFLCPKTRLPFIAGTYYPKKAMAGALGFSDLLSRVSQFYQGESKDFANLRSQVRRGYDSLNGEKGAGDIELVFNVEEVMSFRETATASLLLDADTYHGGFGQSAALQSASTVRPKFPMPMNLNRLLHTGGRRHRLDAGGIQHALFSLTKMACGGLQDQLGGGFFRYAVDTQWQIPHFEKMLYDNALLLSLYARGSLCLDLVDDRRQLFSQAAEGIIEWLAREMSAQGGGFYSTLDADYEGGEGSYYVWDRALLLVRLSAIEKSLLTELYGLDGGPNFGSTWHLNQTKSEREAFQSLGLSLEEGQGFLARAKAHCLGIRHQQKPPARDEKILASWNALMIGSLAEASLYLNDDRALDMALETLDFIQANIWQSGRLHSHWIDGKPRGMGFLDDYVFLMDALLKTLQLKWRDKDYRMLLSLAEALLNNFEDVADGGFFFTAHDHETLIHRLKPETDNVLPAGNGIAAQVMFRLGHLAAEPRYLESARRTVYGSRKKLQQMPQNHHSLLVAHEEMVHATPLVILMGDSSLESWRRRIHQEFAQRVQCYLIPEGSEHHPPEAMALELNQGLVCFGGRCLLPQKDLEPLLQQLRVYQRELDI